MRAAAAARTGSDLIAEQLQLVNNGHVELQKNVALRRKKHFHDVTDGVHDLHVIQNIMIYYFLIVLLHI